jgi:aliphatic nitrilase
MKAIRAGVVQAAPVFMNLDASVKKAISLIERAQRDGIEILGFPELWLSGYPWFVWLGDPLSWMAYIGEYHANSLAVKSQQMAALQAAVAKAGIHVVLGFSERAGNSRFMSQALIGPTGEIHFVRRKIKPTHAERTVFGEGDGSGLCVSDTLLGRVGALNCWENLQSFARMTLIGLGEEIHIASWPSFTFARGVAHAISPEMADRICSVYALEAGCFVLSATALTGQDVFDKLCDTPAKIATLSPQSGRPGGGFSMIYGPDGRALCERMPETEEGILQAGLNPDELSIAKTFYDPVGHYSRNDLFDFRVNRMARQSVLDVCTPTEPSKVTEVGFGERTENYDSLSSPIFGGTLVS